MKKHKKPEVYDKEAQAHYLNYDPQPLEVCEIYELDHHKASAVEYILRAGKKEENSEHKDMRKALFYIQRWLEINPEDKKGN